MDDQNDTMPQDLGAFRNPIGFRGRSAFVVQFWWLVQSTVFRWSPQFMYGFRRAILRAFGAKIGRGVKVRPGAKITYPWKISIGDHSWVGDGTELYSLAEITIGRDVAIAQDVSVVCGSHKYNAVTFDIYAEPIVIEDGCWLCARAFIHQGVTLGRGSVIGACAVVTRSTAPMSINVGFPAKSIGDRGVGR